MGAVCKECLDDSPHVPGSRWCKERQREELFRNRGLLAAALKVIEAQQELIEWHESGQMHDRDNLYGKRDAALAEFRKAHP